MMHGAMIAGMNWLGMVAIPLVWIGMIALILWGVLRLFPQPRTHFESDALEIVQRRFARGEISREEYLQAVETLQDSVFRVR